MVDPSAAGVITSAAVAVERGDKSTGVSATVGTGGVKGTTPFPAVWQRISEDRHDGTVWSRITGCCRVELESGLELEQWPRRSGKQFKHSLLAFLHEQFLQLPLVLHRQQTGGILQ